MSLLTLFQNGGSGDDLGWAPEYPDSAPEPTRQSTVTLSFVFAATVTTLQWLPSYPDTRAELPTYVEPWSVFPLPAPGVLPPIDWWPDYPDRSTSPYTQIDFIGPIFPIPQPPPPPPHRRVVKTRRRLFSNMVLGGGTCLPNWNCINPTWLLADQHKWVWAKDKKRDKAIGAQKPIGASKPVVTDRNITASKEQQKHDPRLFLFQQNIEEDVYTTSSTESYEQQKGGWTNVRLADGSILFQQNIKRTVHESSNTEQRQGLPVNEPSMPRSESTKPIPVQQPIAPIAAADQQYPLPVMMIPAQPTMIQPPKRGWVDLFTMVVVGLISGIVVALFMRPKKSPPKDNKPSKKRRKKRALLEAPITKTKAVKKYRVKPRKVKKRIRKRYKR